MTDSLALPADADAYADGPTSPFPVLFDLERDAPALYAAVIGRTPEVSGVLNRARTDLPLDGHCGERLGNDWYRLPRHYRSVCRPIGGGADRQSLGGLPVVVYKGTEHLLADFPDYLQWMCDAQFRNSDLPLALHLALKLRMPPGAMPLDEALREQTISVELHARHLAAFGTLAHAPLPLLVSRVASTDNARYLQRLRDVLPGPAMERLEARVGHGLAVAVSFYPAAPVRLDNLEPPVPEALAAYVDAVLDNPDGLVDAWITLLARLLALGYMPLVPWNAGWGACFDTGNVCMDGGCADLVTLTRFEAIADDGVFRSSLMMTLDLLCHTVTRLCRHFGSPFAPRVEIANPTPLTFAYVKPRFDEIFARESAGRTIDPRLRTTLQMRTFADLVAATEGTSYSERPYQRVRP